MCTIIIDMVDLDIKISTANAFDAPAKRSEATDPSPNPNLGYTDHASDSTNTTFVTMLICQMQVPERQPQRQARGAHPPLYTKRLVPRTLQSAACSYSHIVSYATTLAYLFLPWATRALGLHALPLDSQTAHVAP